MSKRKILVTLMATALVMALAGPAHATASGDIAFECEARFPSWPTPAGTGECNSGIPFDSAVVDVAGIDDWGIQYAVAGPGHWRSQFNYNTACVAGEPPLIFNSTGQFRVFGVPAAWATNLTEANLESNWSITGVGGVIVIVSDPLAIDFEGTTATAHGIAPGIGTGYLVTFLNSWNVCPSGGFMTGIMTGRISWPS